MLENAQSLISAITAFGILEEDLFGPEDLVLKKEEEEAEIIALTKVVACLGLLKAHVSKKPAKEKPKVEVIQVVAVVDNPELKRREQEDRTDIVILAAEFELLKQVTEKNQQRLHQLEDFVHDKETKLHLRRHLNAGSLIMCAFAIIGIIIAYCLPWYQVTAIPATESDITPPTLTSYYWSYYVLFNTRQGSSETHYYMDAHTNLPHVKQTFDISLAFLTLGLIETVGLVLIDLELRRRAIRRDRKFRIASIVTGISAVSFLLISFFSFLNITSTFAQDHACDLLGDNTFFCTSFIGSKSIGVIYVNYNFFWGATGWWALFAAILCAIPAAVTAALQLRPRQVIIFAETPKHEVVVEKVSITNP